jgi:site-specific recombinase XerC
LKTGRVEVKHGVIGGAKGGKGRTVYLGKTTRNAMWYYLVDPEDANDPDAPVFLDQHGRHFNPGSLRQLIKDIADRAGVKDAYPHKFRHTFAITYLRSGGDIFTLQSLLGHSSLEMVQLDPGLGVTLAPWTGRDLQAVFVEGQCVVVGHHASVLEAEVIRLITLRWPGDIG